MGVTRKVLSVCSLGLVDFRSDKERTARSSKQTAKEAKRQTELLEQMARQQQAQGQVPSPPPGSHLPPPPQG